MRQPGSDLNIDPFKAIGTVEIPSPKLEGAFLKDHQNWANNTAIARQHKYCASLCVNFKSGSALDAEEGRCIETCFNKYGQAFSFFQQEKNHYMSTLKEHTLRGEDIYDARSIWDACMYEL